MSASATVLRRRIPRIDRHVTYPDVVFKLDSSGRVQLDLLQSLSYNIVRLTLTSLCCLDGSGLI